MKITEEQLEYVVAVRPKVVGDNTEFLASWYEIVCEARGIECSWQNIRALMHEYKPENVMRKRRKHFGSTEAQYEKEQEYRFEFSPDHC